MYGGGGGRGYRGDKWKEIKLSKKLNLKRIFKFYFIFIDLHLNSHIWLIPTITDRTVLKALEEPKKRGMEKTTFT